MVLDHQKEKRAGILSWNIERSNQHSLTFRKEGGNRHTNTYKYIHDGDSFILSLCAYYENTRRRTMSKQSSITIRLTESLKEDFSRAVQKELLNALNEGRAFEHITISEVIRSFIKIYCREAVG